MMKIPELLAPVGSSEHLKTAILSGASSIYLSGEEFGARKYAENFNLAEIREAVKYAHFYNVKVYVTVNILIKERELKRVSEYLLELYKIGVDAVLVQDIGLVKFINENIPKLAVHASTQMNIHNIEGVNWAYKHNIKRIVLPRECRLDEVRELINHAHSMGIEVEIFAHGALCYSYSGHCLLSSFQGGRSGNRGTCAQPCREQYELSVNKNKIVSPKTEGNYLLSPRDLSLYENLNEIINLEVDSIKIEGRMRSNEYVATVVSNYRQRLNSLRHDKLSKTLNRKIDDLNHSKNRKGKQGKNSKLKKAKDKEFISRLKNEEREKNRKSMEELELVFNREFTTGHLIPKNRQNIMNRKKPGHSGLYIGNIHRYNEQTGEIHISLNDDLIYIPEKGDGLLIEVSPSENKEEGRKRKTKKDKGKLRKSKMNKKSEERSNEQKGKSYNFGFDISSNPTLRDPKDKHWIKRPQDKDVTHRILIVKKVRENGRINIPLTKGSKVYLTKRNSLMKEIKELSKNVEKHSYKKSILELYFRIDSENYPHLKGNLKLDNGKVITLSHKGDEAWEEAINKPISNETIRKQLIKIGNLPYYIEKITVNNNKKLFAPISKINELRRNFFDQLEEEVKKSYLPKENDIKEAEAKIKSFNEKRLNKTASSNIKEEMISNNIKEEMSSNNIKEEMISSNPDEKDAPLSNEDPHSDKKNMNLAIYINNLKILKQINNLKLKDGKSLYDRVYLEIPPERDFEKVSKENIDNYNPIKANELNISYCVNYLKEAIEIAGKGDYHLIWKLPNIAHRQTSESIIKIMGILNKMDLHIDVISSLIGFDDSLKDRFRLKTYGNYPLNVFNIEAVKDLDKYEILSISPELYGKDMENLLEDYSKIGKIEECHLPELEILVQGNIESMTSRKEIISKKQLRIIEKYNKKQLKKGGGNKHSANEYYLKNKKDQYYPIKRDLNEENIIILNSEEFSLINEIEYLKDIGFENFSIDARWKEMDYIKEIGMIYRKSIDEGLDMEISKEIIGKYCDKTSDGNFNTGLK